MFKQQQDVIATLFKRRNRQCGNIQAVVQIGAKAAFIGGLTQVFFACGDNADIQHNQLIAAHPLDGTFLQQAQQFDLHLERHAFDFIQEHRAAVGKLKLADAAFIGAGESTRLVAE